MFSHCASCQAFTSLPSLSWLAQQVIQLGSSGNWQNSERKKRIFSTICKSTCFCTSVFPKWWSTFQTIGEASDFRTTANFIQWPPSPLGTIQKVTIFFYNSPRPLHWWKQAKPTLCVCLLEKIASFIYRPLALFSQRIPGLNAISQETLPMCSPVIPHC